jgi:competence protein ComEC
MYLPNRKAATLAGVIVALLYALIAGFSVPTQRTLYMLIVFAVVLWSGRQLAISQVLATALMVVVLLDPWAVISAGFWLSFGAVALLAYALSARVGQAYWLRVAVKTQWVVTIGMLPLLLIMFNQVSIISPVANALAIPLISFVVTPLALFGSFLNIDTLIVFAHEILSAGMWTLKWLDRSLVAVWQQQAPPSWTLLPAMVGVIWLLMPRGWPLRWFGLLGFLPMFLIAPVNPVIGDMKVTVLDVGQGLSVVVQTATHTLLYDAGPQYGAHNDAGAGGLAFDFV